MYYFYFPDFLLFDKESICQLTNHCVTTQLSYDTRVSVAIIRPPESFTHDHISCFPNLKYVLSDTTGVHHLELCHQYPHLKVITLRDLSSNARQSLTAAAELAFLLLQLSLRPILQASYDYISYLHGSKDKLIRSDYIGKTFNELNVGILGFGRIGSALYNQLPSYTKSIYVFDTDLSRLSSHDSSNTNLKSFVPVLSMDDLFLQSDVVIIAVTDDFASNNNLISSDFLNKHSLHGLINISRDYIVSVPGVLEALESNRLHVFCSDFINLTGCPIDKALKFHASGRMLSLPHMGGCTTYSWRKSLCYILDHFHSLVEA